MTLTLHGYQRRAVKHLHDNDRAGLFLEMGLGKTAITLSALTPDHLPALVVAPKRVTETVWPTEVQLWRPDLTLAVAAGSPAKRELALRSTADLVALGRDNVKDVPVKHGFRAIILDELSGFKDRSTQRWKAARRFTRDVPYVWGLTGTPAANGLLDLWAQLFLLDRGERLGTGITHYRSRYFTPGKQLANGVITGWNLRPGASAAIYRQIDDICLSMQAADELDLPPVNHNRITVPLPDAAKTAYRHMRDTLVAQIDVVGTIHTAANAAVLSAKLSQIAAGFVYSDAQDGSYTVLHTEKIKALTEIIEGTGTPVLVFYRFTAERDAILRAHPEARTIDEPGVISAWNDGRVPVLVAHPASAGHGLNLQHGGHTMVWTSLPWSLEHYQQSVGRLARQGQAHPVVVHYLLAPGTVDAAVLDRLHNKTDVQTALMNALKEGTP